MPREHRQRRGAAARGPNRAAADRPRRGTSRASVATSPSTTSIMPRMFSKINTIHNVVPSVPHQNVMADTLRQHIFVTLANFQKREQLTEQQPQQRFADFYDLVHRMSVHKTRPSVYEVTHACIREWFEAFAVKLTAETLAQSTASSVNIAPAKMMIDFYADFFGPMLTYLASAMAPAERRERVNPKKPVLLHELCCRAFVESILRREPIRNYVTELAVVFFSRSRQRFNDEYLTKSNGGDLADYMQTRFTSPQSCTVMHALLAMLISLDAANLSVFYRLVELPLIKRSLKQARQLSRDQLRGHLSMTDYLQWVANYLAADRYLLEKMFKFPAQSAQAMTELFCHVMASTQMSAIMDHQSSGFSALIAAQDYPKMRAMYEQICGLYSLTKQSALLDNLEATIERQFVDRCDILSSRYNFKRRVEQLAYVQELLTLKNQWDHILAEVFHDGPNATKVNRAVFKFFYDTLLIHEGVSQAVAFYLHTLMQKTNSKALKDAENAQTAKKMRFMCELNRQFILNHAPALTRKLTMELLLSSTQMDRFASLYHLLSLVQYMKDVNTFYDYSKHYYSGRLLSSDSSAFSPEQELEYFDQLAGEIKRVFVDDPVLINSPHVEMTGAHQLLHKHFTQSLNDFRWIATDWRNSKDFWTSEPTRKMFTDSPQFIDTFRILHAGIWKFVEYDRCKLSTPIDVSFRRVEKHYLGKFKNKRLLLNTKHSKATIAARLVEGQVAPMSLTVSLHQLAILEQFNGDVTDQVGAITYEQLVHGGGFLKETNAKLALLSLVYGGLLNYSDGTPVQFELNKQFYDANADQTKDLSALEEVNFWSEDTAINMKTAKLIRALDVADEDIYMASIASSVEDVGANCALILRTDLAQTSEAGERSAVSSGTPRSDMADSSLDSLLVNSLHTTTSISSALNATPTMNHSVIDREIKIEAAIVRVVKRAKRMSSLAEVYVATKAALFSGRGPLLLTEVITIEEVSKALLKLVEKKYIKRNQTGGFEFLVD